MKQLALAAIAALALWGSTASAHGPCHDHHHGCPSCPQGVPGEGPAARAYDPDSVTTLHGTAAAVGVLPTRGGRAGGLHVTLASEGVEREVHLGPTWFLEREGFRIAKGDLLDVTGSIVESDGTSFVVAREIRKGAGVLRLRDERGHPAVGGRPDALTWLVLRA
jgi:hypothetical protein